MYLSRNFICNKTKFRLTCGWEKNSMRMNKSSSRISRSTGKTFLRESLHTGMGAFVWQHFRLEYGTIETSGKILIERGHGVVGRGKQVSHLTNVNISKGIVSNVKFRKDKCQFINPYS